MKTGQEVRAGQQIGVVGKTGNAAGVRDAHLHFEVRYGSSGVSSKDRTIINPMYYLPVE
jgi:murein DD-endopeptidase MepM/ murein hydrolase activator NlpD